MTVATDRPPFTLETRIDAMKRHCEQALRSARVRGKDECHASLKLIESLLADASETAK